MNNAIGTTQVHVHCVPPVVHIASTDGGVGSSNTGIVDYDTGTAERFSGV